MAKDKNEDTRTECEKHGHDWVVHSVPLAAGRKAGQKTEYMCSRKGCGAKTTF